MSITYRIELSELPLTTKRSRYCKHAIPRLWPFSVRTNSHVDVFHTLMVRSPDADTTYFSSKSTTFTAALCPTSTRRRLISFGDVISQTAIDRSLNFEREKKIGIITVKSFYFASNGAGHRKSTEKAKIGRTSVVTFEQVTIMPLLKRKCNTASQW